MIGHYATAYLLGAFTFWPIVALSLYFLINFLNKAQTDRQESSDQELDAEKRNNSPPVQLFPRSNLNNTGNFLDLESDVEIRCWVRVSPSYIASDVYEEAEVQTQKQTRQSTARSSLQRLMTGAGLFAGAGPNANNIGNTKPNTDLGERTTTATASVSSESIKVRSIAKCPKYWVVLRGAQLQLYEDKYERKLIDYISMNQYIVSLWPQDLEEYELFYRRYPIVLISRADREGVVSLDLYPGIPPRDAVYLYISSPLEKEDLYFSLIKASKYADAMATDISPDQYSLGPRDPVTMAKPIQVKKAEAQQLQSSVWNNELPLDTQWLNALLGRIFLALKDSELADDYLRRKFTMKLKPISDSSNIIGPIDVKNISSGSSAPFISNIKLKELTPDGNLVLSASMTYNGGFKVILATSVKLAAVTSLTSAVIPVELAATLRNLKGSVIIRVKPAPSDRIWYAFETMPDVDLHIEPAVYDTHISLGVVTKFIRSKILDSLKETLVMPFMDDICFYDTSDSFYRGGIWESVKKGMKKDAELKGQREELLASSQLAPRRSASGASSLSSKSVTPSTSNKNLPEISGGGGAAAAAPASNTPRLRNRLSSSIETESIASTTEAAIAPTSSTAVQRISNWVKRKRSTKDLAAAARGTDPAADTTVSSIELDGAGDTTATPTMPPASDAESIFNMSPTSMRQRSRAASTTQVTATVAPADKGLPQEKPPLSDKTQLLGPSLSPTKQDSPPEKPKVKRKPVPAPPSTLPVPIEDNNQPNLITKVQPSIETSDEVVNGEITEPVISRRSSISSMHSRKSSYAASDASSLRSGNWNRGPSLPPRHRRVVPLSNVPPERDTE